MWSRNSIPRYLPKKNEDIFLPKDLYLSIYSNIIHNNQTVETI